MQRSRFKREPNMTSTVHLTRLTGHQISPYLADVARLRISVFCEFPYLYVGTPAYEERYLATYSRSPASLFVLAWDQGRIVGAATGVPLHAETAEIQQPFVTHGYALDQVFTLVNRCCCRSIAGGASVCGSLPSVKPTRRS